MFRTLRKLLLTAAAAAVVGIGTLSPQPAHAAALGTFFVNSYIDWFLRGQTYTPPSTVYVALATSSSSAASCGTEVSGGSYARVAVTSSLANWAGTQGTATTAASSGTSGTTSNNVIITFPAPTAAWGSIVGFCIFDASTSGHLLFFAPLTTSKTVNGGDSAPSFAAAALTYSIS